MGGSAVQALLISAQLLGIDPRVTVPAAPPAKASAPAPARTEIMRIPLSKIASMQKSAWVPRIVGMGTLELAASFDATGSLWIKLRSQGRASAYSRTELEKGLTQTFPSGRFNLSFADDAISIIPVDPPGPKVSIQSNELVRALYDNAKRVRFDPVDYAVAYEDGSQGPASLSLIRVDENGLFWVNYHTLGELSQLSWFVGIDGILYGVKIDGDDLVFVSEPLPGTQSASGHR